MALAYSYLRFSSPKQADGDSVRRQTQARERWLADHPDVRLDPGLKLTDAGRSAFRRKDWDTYALARFVEHIKSGRVEPGSYLLVENLDRLSRESAGEATELFLSIVNKGVVVVQLSPVVLEFRRPVDSMSLMFAIVELSRGHSESAIKSERGRAFWSKKQREAATKVVTRMLPGWVRYEDGRLVLHEAHAATVRRMFGWARDGYGATAIAKMLNEEGVPTMGRREVANRGQSEVDPAKRARRPVVWSGALVWHVLTSRAAIGEYVPYRQRRGAAGQPVPDYFPRVVDPDTFHAVQLAISTRSRVGRGRRGKHVHLFSGLLRDARDGGTFSYWTNGGHPTVLIPVNAKEGRGTTWVSFPAGPFERAVLSELVEIKPSEVRGDDEAGRKVESVRGQVKELERLEKLWTDKMDDPAIVDVVAAKLAEVRGRRKVLAAELAEYERMAASPVREAWGEFRSLAELLGKEPSDELRVKVRSALRRSLEGVTCLFVRRGRDRLAEVRVDFAGGGGYRGYFILYRPPIKNGVVSRPGRLVVRSLKQPEAAAAGLPFLTMDLRDPLESEVVRQSLEVYPKAMIDELLASGEEV